MGYDLDTWTTPIAAFGLNWLLQSSVLLVLGLAAGRWARPRGPALQSALYRTTLAAILICPIASALLAASGFESVILRRAAPNAPIAASIPPRNVPTPLDEPMRPEGVQEPRHFENQPAAAPPTQWMTLGNAARWGVAAWFLGSMFLLVRLAVQQARMRKLRQSAHPAEAEAKALCTALATRMNLSSPTVWRSPFLFSPCLDGLRRPAILLPEDAAEDLRDAFVHELAHLARRDGVWNLLRRLAVAVLWFQPLLWALSRRMESTAEEVCDDYVVQFGADRARYAGLLVAFAGRALPPRAPAAVGMISARSTLVRRVTRILDASRTLSTRAGKRAMLAILVLGLASTAFAGLLGVGDQLREQTDGDSQEQAEAPAPDVPINGRIVDLEGRPVAGVVVTINDVQVPKGDDLSAWIEGVKNGAPPWVTADRIDWDRKTPEAKGREATTDADGRFRFDGLAAERVVGLSLKGETIAYTRVEVLSRKTDPITAKGFANEYGPGVQTVFGADFTVAAAPGLAVDGFVKDAKSGAPLADAGVWSYRFAGSQYAGTTALKTRTDAQGKFHLVGMPKGKGNILLVVPNDEQPYLRREIMLGNPAATRPIKTEVAMHKGVWIEGKLTERETGKPIPDAWLHYLPFLGNTFAEAVPEFGKDSNVEGVGYQDRFKSKTDGSFRLVGLPGRAIVGAQVTRNIQPNLYMQGAGSEAIAGITSKGWFETYSNPIHPGRLWPTVMKEINPPAEAQVVHVDLQASQGDSVRVRIAVPDGRPMKEIATLGRVSRGEFDRALLDGPGSEVLHLYPGEERTVMFRHIEGKLGKVARVKKGDDAESSVVVTLEPLATLTGTVADPDGIPVSGATVRIALLPSGDFSPCLSEVLTDEKGRFVAPDVPTGCDYFLAVKRSQLIRNNRFASVARVVVKPGETTDVGEIRFKKK